MIRRPPRSPLFPSPPLFRSGTAMPGPIISATSASHAVVTLMGSLRRRARCDRAANLYDHAQACKAPRSEEHTSELQSPCNLVCRLLLEKKKQEKDCDIVRHQ